jgi:outer membrane protein assembly factor BamB
VYGFDASTGVLLGNVPIVGYIGESPAVANGRVYLGTAWKLNALHLPSTSCKVDLVW